MGRLFGTDGVRGVANIDLTCDLAYKIGCAAATVLSAGNKKPRFLIGKDTRRSSDMLENALAAGLCSVGADVEIVGVVPTPAVAYLVTELKADAGVMISASHNPFEYNGIKLFNSEGYKLADAVEEEIEVIILGEVPAAEPISGADLGGIKYNFEAVDLYIDHIVNNVDGDLSGLKIAADCANGSSSVTAEKLFKKLNADVTIINASPDGININDNCGSTHLEGLIETVKRLKCDIGVAFDGDADRCLAIDENGELIDGDKIIAIFSRMLKQKGRLSGNTAVVTSMSNMGFYAFAKSEGINVAVTGVGDRYVLEEMLKNGYSIGGEQSGHIIFLDFATTGDGQTSGVQLISALKASGQKASELGKIMETYPQIMINLRATPEQKAAYKASETVKAAIDAATEKLGEDGRIVVRPSGTEPMIRVMLEGKDEEFIKSVGQEVCAVITAETGAK